MALLWLALLWFHHAQQILFANKVFQSTFWTNTTEDWIPSPTPTFLPSSFSPSSLPTPSPSAFSSSPPYSYPPLQISTPSLPSISPTSSFATSSSPASLSPLPPSATPSPAPDKPDEEGSKAALRFLHSGDPLLLSEANCSRRFELHDLQGPPPDTVLSHLMGSLDCLLHAANFLNMMFQANDMRESSVREDMEWYHALVRSLAGGDLYIHRALLSFTTHPMSSKPQLLLQATKEGHEVLLKDLSSLLHHRRRGVDWGSWASFQVKPPLIKAILLNDLRSLDTPKWSRGDSYMVNSSHVQWSQPFLECEQGRFGQGWMLSLSAPFYGLKPDLSPEFKGTLRVDVRLLSLGIDQCSQGPGWFSNTHRCDENSTQCLPEERESSILGRYRCVCRPGYYRIHHEGNVNMYIYDLIGSDNLYVGATTCQRCSEGCTTCVDGTPCLVREDWALRVTVLSLQAAGMLGVFMSMLVSYHFRESKRIRASGLILLETILFGSLLLYFPVFILYFKPSVFRCLALRWVRLLGFSIVYGTIVLKLYRVMKVFISRTAQRVPYMTSARLLRMLSVILLLCIWFLSGWTLGTLENLQRGVPVVIRTQTREGLIFYTCDHDRWDYMMSLAELLFLAWGSFLCYGARGVPSAFHEPRYMGLAAHNEMLVSAAFHVLRFLMVPSLHPDWTLLLFFIHTHGTVTMTLTLLFIPKFLHAGGPPREEIAAEVYEDEMDLRRSRSNLNSSITSAWSEHSLDPDDIREELKKLYAQLEVHKTKKMTINNPHLQKKRSSRRGLGRSIMRRITEIPDSVTRQCGREEREGSPSSSGSQRRRQDSGSVKLREESLRQRVLSLRKSQSTYDQMQEARDAGSASPRLESSARDAALRDSLMRQNLTRNVSLRSRGDSLRQAPLVCKSLSAHNLLADKKPLNMHAGALQKSHSMLGSSRGRGPLIGPADTPSERAMEGSRNPLLGGSFDKAEVCPWELQDLPSSTESRTQKHVTYAPGKCSSMDTSHDSGKPHVSHGKKGEPVGKHQSLGSSEEARSTYEGRMGWSFGGKQQNGGDPSPIRVRAGTAQNVLESKVRESCSEETAVNVTESLETTQPLHKSTLKSLVLAVRAFKGKAAGREQKEAEKHDVEVEEASEKHHMEDICPWEIETSLPEGMRQKSQSQDHASIKRLKNISPQHEGQVIAPKSQEALPSPLETSKKTPSLSKLERLSQLREAICPWESIDGQREAPQKSDSVESKRSEICPWESTDSEGPGGPLSLSGSNLSFHSLPTEKVSDHKDVICKDKPKGLRAEICPWEVKEGGGSISEICPWEREETDSLTKISALEKKKVESLKEEICPWESTKEEEVNSVGLSGRNLSKKLEELGRQRDAVCPWESEESGGCSPGPLSQSQSKTFDGGPVPSKTSDSLDLEVRRGEICPWESLDSEGTPAILSQSQSHSWESENKGLGVTGTCHLPQVCGKASRDQIHKSQSKQESLQSLSSDDHQPLSKILSKSEGDMCELHTSVAPTQPGRRWHHSMREPSRVYGGEECINLTPKEETSTENVTAIGGSSPCKNEDICPWEVQKGLMEGNNQSSTKSAEICPWDFQ
ncbi:probable G-protein coupled receptor 179 [Bombina bombina]|uniref:probable G-protein coupled receptor 179 n=1 Tax=Bombina bombina TaxID=8345 RepID=UPI00235B03E6|nr:probable G-protein coupled receptor 179 [Bombina bombina]